MEVVGFLRERSWVMAFFAASLVHLMLLTRAGFVNDSPIQVSARSKEITVSLVQKKIEKKVEEEQTATDRDPTVPPKEPQALTPASKAPIEPTSSNLPTDIIVAQPAEASDQTSTKLQLSINSKEFRRFIESETERNANEAGKSIADFNQTFETAPLEGYAEELSPYHSDSIPKGGNNDFAVAKDGRVRCFVRTLNLLDGTAGANFVSKDCTPKKKFDLKLNQPNNGWSNR